VVPTWIALTAVLGGTASVPIHPPLAGDQADPAAALGASGLVVTWVDRRPSKQTVVYAHARDLALFSAPFPVSDVLGEETIRPHAAAAGLRAVITWADATRGDHDVYVAISDDGGQTFAPPMLVAGGPGGQVDPRAAVLTDGRIALTFHDGFGSTAEDDGVRWRVRAIVSDADGRFGAGVVPSGPARVEAFDVFASIDGEGTEAEPLVVAWLHEGTDGATMILAASSIDGGASFSAPMRIDSPLGRHLRPRVAVTRSAVIATFASLLPTGDAQAKAGLVLAEDRYLDVLAVTSTTAGRTFLTPTLVNDTRALTQHQVDVASAGDHVAIAWIDHSTPNARRVVVRRSSDGGVSFGAEVIVVDDASAASSDVAHPSVAVSSDGTVVVVFEDARGGSWDVRAAILR
jgi:hypothetical protein